MMKKKYQGVIVPLVTPVDKRGRIDASSLRKLLDSVTAEGCHPMVLGTTGEASSLSERQKQKVVATLASSKGKAVLYAGVSDNSFTTMVRSAERYADEGVDVLVVHLPTYYLVDAPAMLSWFESFADKSPLPVMLYNIPQTTHMSIPLEVADRLSTHPNIAGMKDSERSEERLFRAIPLWKDRADFSHFTGWAAQCFPALQAGSDGIVPSSGNLLPRIYTLLYHAAGKSDALTGTRMQQLSDTLGRLYQGGRLLGQSLAALKAMLGASGLCGPDTLPPISTVSPSERQQLQENFKRYCHDILPLLASFSAYDR